MEQPTKQRLKKRLERFDQKREEWVAGHKKHHNLASIKDEAILLVCSMYRFYLTFNCPDNLENKLK
jgi:hypothetical protein